MTASTETRCVRMQAPTGTCGGASIDGISYEPNSDGTITVPAGKPVRELTALGFAVLEVINPPRVTA